MFGPKSKQLVQLEHFLERRQRAPGPSPVLPIAVATIISAAAFVVVMALGVPWLVWPVFAVSWAIMYFSMRVKKKRTPEDDLLQRADAVADAMREQSARRRLHLVLHPGVAATLNECADCWRRILVASEPKLWKGVDVQPHWREAREAWVKAANVGMAEALLLAESSMTMRPQRHRAEEVVEDLLDTYVFTKPRRGDDPLPPSFGQLRDLAEKLSILAGEVEGALRSLPAQGSGEPVVEVGKGLDEVLGELRSIQQAEAELRQDLRS